MERYENHKKQVDKLKMNLGHFGGVKNIPKIKTHHNNNPNVDREK